MFDIPVGIDYTRTAEYESQKQETARQTLRAQMNAESAKLDNAYSIAKLGASSAAAALKVDKWYKQEQIKLLKRTADLERDKFGLETQRFQFDQDKFELSMEWEQKQFETEFRLEKQKFGEFKDQFRANLAEEQRQFGATQGLDILKTGVQYAQKPSDYVMASNFAQGIAGDPRFSVAVNGLLKGQNARLFGAAGGAPQAANLGGLGGMYGGVPASAQGTTAADQLAGGQAGGSAYNLAANAAKAQSLVDAGRQLTAAGGGSLGAQALESMDPMTRGLTESGVNGAGGSWDDLVDQYTKSRIVQGNPLAY